MTTLNRRLQRETAAVYRGRNIIIQLEPPFIIRVKEKGRRLWYETTVEAVFSLAAKQHAEKIRKERRGKKRRRREV
ncbi:MAG: hypothetical protein HQL08_08655 [Nitrospirae bacterium]|nr:hypothetical protein [Nitrospirota bacterium]